jgi:anti-anti-sigma factor
MNEPAPVRADDALDWLHEQGKQRSEAVPDLDVEETLIMVRIADQLSAPEQDPDKPGTSSGAFAAAFRVDSGTEAAVDSAQLELVHQAEADGGATVKVSGELDIHTADRAYAYLREIVDNQTGPVTLNLAGLTFCDAAGLGVLARMAGYAKRSGCSLRLKAARPALLRIMQMTGMDQAFPEIASPSFQIALPHERPRNMP